MSDILRYRIESDSDGYFLVDEEGQDITPTTRYRRWEDAVYALGEMIREERLGTEMTKEQALMFLRSGQMPESRYFELCRERNWKP